MQKYSEITYYFFTVFDCYLNFGIGDFVAGTTPVALIEQTLTFRQGIPSAHSYWRICVPSDGLIKPLEKWKVLISGDHNKYKAAKINELENCFLKIYIFG